MAWVDIPQNEDAWLDLRAGKLTGSAVAKVMANYGKAFGEPAKKLAVDIAVEQVTGKRIEAEGYNNAHMQRGHIEEPLARMLYEEEYFCTVTNGGFYDNGDTGCSPDGLVGDDGIIEIKSGIPSIHYARIKKNSFDSTYKWQLLFNLNESGRAWMDFISYCSDFPAGSRLFVFRLLREEYTKELIMMAERISEFFVMVEEIKGDIR